MLSRAEGRRAFFYTPIIVDGQTRTIAEALHYNSLVFVAQDGGFLCQTCVSSPCREMLEATCDFDESELPPECAQWCIIGAQEPELGHGDTCDHCGAFTLPKPDDVDNYLDPWPLLDKFAQASPNLDPRAYGGDRNGPVDCNGNHYYYGRTPLGPRENDAINGKLYDSSSGTPCDAGASPDCEGL